MNAFGAIETDALKAFLADDAIRQGLVDRTPMRSVGSIEDAAAAALFLAYAPTTYFASKASYHARRPSVVWGSMSNVIGVVSM